MKNKDSVSIIIGGDFAFTKENENVIIKTPKKIWGNSIDYFKNADLSIINLEMPLTDSNNAISKTGPNLKGSVKVIDSLKAAGINLVTLANNHILDYGNKGVSDTISVCNKSDIDTVGAGNNLKEAQKIYYKKIKGIKIAVINFAENEWNSADSKNAGSNPMDLIDNIKQIKEAKNNSDFLLVIIHGGHEYYKYPSPRMQKVYRFYVECGADMIVGHHTHCISGYEFYNNVPIFYSLGNLFFPGKNRSNDWYEGLFLTLNLSKNEEKIDVDFHLNFFSQCENDFTINMLKDSKLQKIKDRIENINKVINEKKYLLSEWNNYTSEKSLEYLQYITIPSHLLRRIIKKVGLLKIFNIKKDNKVILNLIRCESHYELFLSILKRNNLK